MLRRLPFYSLILGVGLVCVLSLSGCNVWDFLADLFRFNDGANAQQSSVLPGDLPVETWLIIPGSFSIDPDSGTVSFETNVEVHEEVVIYQKITGQAFFRLEGDTNSTAPRRVNLNSNSVIIERPAANTLTLINTTHQ